MQDFNIVKETDTRDGSDLYVIRFSEKLSADVYKEISNIFKAEKIYYSSFKKGFISKREITKETVESLISLLDVELKQTNKKATTVAPSAPRVEYKTKATDYLTYEELLEKAKEYSGKESGISYWGRRESNEEIYKRVVEIIDRLYKDNYENELRYVREAILHKSLGRPFDEFGNRSFVYFAIWDSLPVIPGLEITEKAFTAVWGYDQTNVSVAFLLNKKVWGLDVAVSGRDYYLVRIKDNSFSSKNGVERFSYDPNYQETMKLDDGFRR